MKHSLTLPTLLTLALTFISCFGSKKDDDGTIIPPVPQDGRVVYFLGGYRELRNDRWYDLPAVWKNGDKQSLPCYANEPGYMSTSVESIFVSNDNKVYVLGEIHIANNPLSGHYLWIDGVPQKLDMNAISLFVSGNDVYILGYNEDSRAIWKNGTIIYNITDAWAGLLYVSGNDIYVYGRYNDKNAIWKNGTVLYTLPDDNGHREFCVSDNDVYGVGEYQGLDSKGEGAQKAAYWKNGVRQALNIGKDNSGARSIAVSGNDVYVAGFDHGITDVYARLWKNGVVQPLKDIDSDTTFYAVSVFGNDVYVLGTKSRMTQGTTSIIWKNGEVYQRLPNYWIGATPRRNAIVVK